MRLFLCSLQFVALISLYQAPAQAFVRNGPDRDGSLPAPAIYAAYDVIAALDPTTGAIERTGPQLPFIGTSAMLASPNRARLYVFAQGGAEIEVVSTRTLQTLATIAPIQGFPETIGIGWLAISPNGNLIYVVDAAYDGIEVISTQTNSEINFVPMGDHVGGVTVGDYGKRVYVTLPSQNRISVLNAGLTKTIASIFEGKCAEGLESGKCQAEGLETSSDTRYVVGLSMAHVPMLVGIDSTTDQIVGKGGIDTAYPPFLAFVGINAAANQVALYVDRSPSGNHTVFMSTVPPFSNVSYDFPVGQYDSAFTAAFDPSGTIGYACGDPRMGPVVQFTAQSYQFLSDLGVPNALVLAP